MTGRNPLITLNNGGEIPALGLGVFQSAPEETAGAVEAALSDGYRLIDTAAAYFNEREVGEGIRRSRLDRSEVFIETKVWVTDYGYDATLHAFDKSARKPGVERLDLLLLRQPLSSAFDRTLDAYQALEKLLRQRIHPGELRSEEAISRHRRGTPERRGEGAGRGPIRPTSGGKRLHHDHRGCGVCRTLYMTEDAFASATGTKDKELFKIDGATHIETYWAPKYVAATTDKLTDFYAKHL